jgi:hypothetical protein
MTNTELIRIIGNVIIEVDIYRSMFGRETDERKLLDDIRDELDKDQRKLVRNGIDADTERFKEHTESLKQVNKELCRTNKEMEKTAQQLETIAKFVDVVRKIVGFSISPIPV